MVEKSETPLDGNLTDRHEEPAGHGRSMSIGLSRRIHGAPLSANPNARMHNHTNRQDLASKHVGEKVGEASSSASIGSISPEFSLAIVPSEFRFSYSEDVLRAAHALILAVDKPKEVGGYILNWYEAILRIGTRDHQNITPSTQISSNIEGTLIVDEDAISAARRILLDLDKET